ncbi:MAG: glycerate kinase [Anaerotignum faecicola]
MNEILSDAKKILHTAIQASLPDEAVKKFIGGKTFAFEGRVIVIAIGKAAWNMAKAAAENIPHRIDTGIVLTKYDHAKGEIPDFTILEAGHPLPDENTILGTQKIMDAVSGLTEKDTVFFLVSGGGSALFECPAGELTLADFLDITDQLLKCGADIVEINTIRKHLSAVKGGKFRSFVPCTGVLHCSERYSGRPPRFHCLRPACADASTAAEAFAISEKYNLKLTEEMRKQLAMETPKTLANVTMEITGSVTQLCADAARAAEQLGYTPLVLTNMLDCEAREAGRFLASIAKTIRKDGLPLRPPCAILCGGETVVHITGKGKGGRNQELALAAAERIAGMEGIVIAAAGSDGTDGPTDAAGGIVDGKTCGILAKKGISIPAVLAENDSNAALAAADALLITGATGTNVNDIYLLLCQ